MTSSSPVRDRVRTIIDCIRDGLFEKEEAIRLSLLACIAAESIFLLGPPGVAKSLIARRVKFAFRGARSFEYLMGRFSTPEEIFGPISISKLRDEDSYERIVDRYLPTADIVFLDEVWKASPPIQNALLTALNEKLYRNGNQEIRLPMKGFIAASNELPEPADGLDAFWDRFLLRVELEAIADADAFIRMVLDTEDVYADQVPEEAKITDDEYREWQRKIDAVEVGGEVVQIVQEIRAALSRLADERKRANQTPLFVSDRRWKKIFRLLRTSAFLNGRTGVDAMDCFVIAHAVWNARDQIQQCREIVHNAIRMHGYTTSVDPGAIAGKLDSLKQDVERRTLQVTEEELLSPVLVDGEYFRVLGYRTDGEVRIWKGDFEAVEPGTAASIELFQFDAQGTYMRSSTCDITVLSENSVSIDGKVCELDAEHRKKSVTVSTAPAESDLAAWDERSDSLVGECRVLLDRIIEYRDRERIEAEANLFVPRRHAVIALANLENAAGQIARLTAEIEANRAFYRSLI